MEVKTEKVDSDEGSSTKNMIKELKDETVVVRDVNDSEDDFKIFASGKFPIVLPETFSSFKT